jgi:hypothetical protein
MACDSGDGHIGSFGAWFSLQGENHHLIANPSVMGRRRIRSEESKEDELLEIYGKTGRISMGVFPGRPTIGTFSPSKTEHFLTGGNKKEKPKAIYTSLNRSKKWFFKWLKRYQTGSRDWYKEQSRAPLRSPNEISQGKTDFIISTRQQLESEPYAQIGVSAIKWELTKLGMAFPSDRTIHRILKREGLVKKNFLCSQGDRVSTLYRSSSPFSAVMKKKVSDIN